MIESFVMYQLPARMESSDAVGLGEQLALRYQAVASPKKKPVEGAPVHVAIPPNVAASWKRFAVAHDELSKAAALRIATTGLTPAAPVEDDDAANAASDDAWRTFEAWLGAWARHADDGKAPRGADAAALYARVFPAVDAMRFIGWRPRKQWVAMQGRMAVLDEPANRELLNGLGGARLHEHLRATHDAFGRAYGFTAVQADGAAATVDVRSVFMAAKDALRQYVTRVAASADPDVPGSEALATWLLAPLHEMVAEFAAAPTKRATPEADKRTPSQPPPPPNA